MYNNIDFNKLFDNESEYKEKYNQGELNVNRIKEVEDMLGYKLPKSYIEFLKIQNGGSISYDFGEWWLTAIYGIGQNADAYLGLEERFKLWRDEWKYPEIGIPFGETLSGGHDMYFMDYSDIDENGEPKIVIVDNEGDIEKSFVANNFKEFINMVYNHELEEKRTTEEINKIEVTNELHRKILFSYIDDLKGLYIFLAILLGISVFLIINKFWFWTILIDLFIILGAYWDIQDIVKRKYICTTGKVRELKNENGKVMCEFEKMNGKGEIISRKYKSIKVGDEVIIILAGDKTLVIEK